MAANRPNRIDLITHGRHSEGRAAGVIKPGHLIERDANGEYTVFNNAAGTVAQPIFAKHDYLQGKTIVDAYADDDVVLFVHAVAGDVVLARLKINNDVANGGLLMASNDGSLVPHTGTNIAIGVAREAIDNTPGTAEEFVRVEVL